MCTDFRLAIVMNSVFCLDRHGLLIPGPATVMATLHRYARPLWSSSLVVRAGALYTNLGVSDFQGNGPLGVVVERVTFVCCEWQRLQELQLCSAALRARNPRCKEPWGQLCSAAPLCVILAGPRVRSGPFPFCFLFFSLFMLPPGHGYGC